MRRPLQRAARKSRDALGSANASGRQPAILEVLAPGVQPLRWLIWSYFWLLLFEGALRKWGAPSLANPLLIVRDPILLAIYGLALARGIFPLNRFVIALAVVGLLSLAASLVGPHSNLGVNLFGFRCDFLHLPLIFVMGRVFDFDSVKRLGLWVLVIAVPMTALVVLQIRSTPDSWLNAG